MTYEEKSGAIFILQIKYLTICKLAEREVIANKNYFDYELFKDIGEKMSTIIDKTAKKQPKEFLEAYLEVLAEVGG